MGQHIGVRYAKKRIVENQTNVYSAQAVPYWLMPFTGLLPLAQAIFGKI
jgi:hypothetical protein